MNKPLNQFQKLFAFSLIQLQALWTYCFKYLLYKYLIRSTHFPPNQEINISKSNNSKGAGGKPINQQKPNIIPFSPDFNKNFTKDSIIEEVKWQRVIPANIFKHTYATSLVIPIRDFPSRYESKIVLHMDKAFNMEKPFLSLLIKGSFLWLYADITKFLAK